MDDNSECAWPPECREGQGTLQRRVYVNIRHSLQELEDSIGIKIIDILQVMLCVHRVQGPSSTPSLLL
jgi:hypothetical protein